MNDRHVLLLDNYDSFTYNLAQQLRSIGTRVTVRYNDSISVEEATTLDATHLIISPGPGRPETAGITLDLLQVLMPELPVLGVCLGHQAIAHAIGGSVVAAKTLMHGKASQVYHDGQTVFEGIANPLEAGRYHSLAVSDEDLPDELTVTAYTSEGEIMGLRHKTLPVEGIQFHPESILTPEGSRLLRNFLYLESRTPA